MGTGRTLRWYEWPVLRLTRLLFTKRLLRVLLLYAICFFTNAVAGRKNGYLLAPVLPSTGGAFSWRPLGVLPGALALAL
jgi:hypothetical protein